MISGVNFKIYDLNGNEYQPSNVKLGIERWGMSVYDNYTMSNDIPVKCTAIFENIQDEILFVKSFSFEIKTEKNRKLTRIDLKDLKVEWK